MIPLHLACLIVLSTALASPARAGGETQSRTVYCGMVADYHYYWSRSSRKGDYAILTFEKPTTQGYWQEGAVKTPNNLSISLAKIFGRPGSSSDSSLFLGLSPAVREAKRLKRRFCVSYPSESTASPESSPIPVYLLNYASGPVVKKASGEMFDDRAILNQLPDSL